MWVMIRDKGSFCCTEMPAVAVPLSNGPISRRSGWATCAQPVRTYSRLPLHDAYLLPPSSEAIVRSVSQNFRSRLQYTDLSSEKRSQIVICHGRRRINAT